MAAKATSDSADIPLSGIFHGARPPETSAEHYLWVGAGNEDS